MNHKFLVVVNKRDEVVGLDTKENCHFGNGILHRAITVFIFNDKNEILLTRRQISKKLWPNFWDTSCSTHVHENETYEQAGERRLHDELGFSCKLKFVLKFQYQAIFQSVGSENEICALLVGNYAGTINPNPNEVSEYKWVNLEQLRSEIDDPNNSPWLKIALKKYLEDSKR